jgi:oligopeptide/dipeptide ABC transporter ATP-binding protein
LSDKENIILEVKNLVVAFQTESGLQRAVDGVSFYLRKGSTLGIVGESGCGKSVTALSIMRLLPKPTGQYLEGEILFDDTDILKLDPSRLHKIRGNRISMIFQEPMTALNPVQTIGKQLSEVYDLHWPEMRDTDILRSNIEILDKVGIPNPGKTLSAYPHQLSGGMRQRIMIAMALVTRPDILIADEPTTALDVTIQAQILSLIRELKKQTGTSVIFITHDLGVIAETCDDVLVMYAGKAAEIAPVMEIFHDPKHPYTKGLLSSIPRLETIPKSRLNIIEGMVPGLDEMPKGCRFENRCPSVMEICKSIPPPITKINEKHFVSCYLYQDQNGFL